MDIMAAGVHPARILRPPGVVPLLLHGKGVHVRPQQHRPPRFPSLQEGGNAASGEITFTTDKTAGSLTTKVINVKGSNLPSTGGMGTVILYVAGIAVFVLAGATLVMALRRRNA